MKLNNQPINGLKTGKNQPIKAYNMAVLNDDTAEINMYGDVVSIVPTDWRTGERIAGYIGVDEFLEDLEAIKDKSNIVVHISSGGGDLYAGLAIYNRLKAVKGTVTTINDGLAASAASLIFQAGDKRQMNAGSNLMTHGVAGFLFGYYNIDDLKEMVAQFKAHNKAIINVYAEAMGVSFDEAKGFVEGETWLTGEEAVSKGLADEVITSAADDDEDKLNNSLMSKIAAMVGDVYKAQFPSAAFFMDKATTAAVPPIAHTSQNKSIETGGKEEMDIKDIKNIEELKNAFPEFVAQIENAAKANAQNTGVSEERARIKAIEEIENTIADKNLINEAKYGENPMTAEQLALKALQTQAAIGATMLNNLEDDAKDSGAEGVKAVPNNGTEEDEDIEAAAKEVANLFKMTKGGNQ